MNFEDQIGRSLKIKYTPKRIVSLVPSQTELLVDLGLKDQIVGITKFCMHPKNLRKDKVIVGGTKEVHYDKIRDLQPDIILCNKEENTQEMVHKLQEIAPVHVSDVREVRHSLELTLQYGNIFAKDSEAEDIICQIERKRSLFEKSTNHVKKYNVGYAIWNEPLMVAGSDTFIDALLKEVGFENAFGNHDGRYPQITIEDLKSLDYILLSSEPFPFVEKHLELYKNYTNGEVVLVDGEFFSWYGSRLLKAYTYFEELLSNL